MQMYCKIAKTDPKKVWDLHHQYKIRSNKAYKDNEDPVSRKLTYEANQKATKIEDDIKYIFSKHVSLFCKINLIAVK